MESSVNMSEGSELLRVIQPLKCVVNPLFFIAFHIQKRGFSVSKTGMAIVVCSLLAILCYKVYFIFNNPGRKFEDYVENYGSLVAAMLCVFSSFGYIVNSKSIVKDLNRIVSKSGLITDQQLCKKMSHVVAFQVAVSHALPLSSSVWVSYHYYEEYDHFLTFVANTCFDYFIMLHFAATSLVFSNTILFCCRIITKANHQLREMDGPKLVPPDAPADKLFVKQESVSRIRLMASNDLLVGMFLNYDKVCQWCLDFNEHFGAPLAACCACNLVDMIMYSYYLTKYGIVELWMFVLVFSYCFLQNWIILYACEKFKKEVHNTGIIVNRLLIETKSQTRRELLQQFSALLLHRKLKFTACGLFSLDFKLIYSAVATVATYLAIAFQFEYATRSSQRNPLRNSTVTPLQ